MRWPSPVTLCDASDRDGDAARCSAVSAPGSTDSGIRSEAHVGGCRRRNSAPGRDRCNPRSPEPHRSAQPRVPARGCRPVDAPVRDHTARFTVGHTSFPAALPRRPRPVGRELVIQLDHVSKRFGDVVAVDDISLHVARGTVLGVIGPSGAGKTTTIRIISGGISPDSGFVRVLGEDPRRFRRRTRESIGYMPQLFVLYPDLTARENVNFVASLFGMPPWRRGASASTRSLELVDLWDARNRRASQHVGRHAAPSRACLRARPPAVAAHPRRAHGGHRSDAAHAASGRRSTACADAGVTVLVTTQYVSRGRVLRRRRAHLRRPAGRPRHAHRPAQAGARRRGHRGGHARRRSTSSACRRSTGVISVRQTGPRALLVVAQDAGAGQAQGQDAVEQAGGTVEFSREYRPTFDEVFAALVTASTRRAAAPPGASQPVDQADQPAVAG